MSGSVSMLHPLFNVRSSHSRWDTAVTKVAWLLQLLAQHSITEIFRYTFDAKVTNQEQTTCTLFASVYTPSTLLVLMRVHKVCFLALSMLMCKFRPGALPATVVDFSGFQTRESLLANRVF